MWHKFTAVLTLYMLNWIFVCLTIIYQKKRGYKIRLTLDFTPEQLELINIFFIVTTTGIVRKQNLKDCVTGETVMCLHRLRAVII